jgi:hypothetical protein
VTTPPAPAVSPEGAAAQLLNQITLGYILSSLLNAALELEIADHRADGPRSSGRVGSQGVRPPDVGKLIDIEMLLMPGGRERTAEEFASLFERAGFELTRIVPTESPPSVVEAVVR